MPSLGYINICSRTGFLLILSTLRVVQITTGMCRLAVITVEPLLIKQPPSQKWEVATEQVGAYSGSTLVINSTLYYSLQ